MSSSPKRVTRLLWAGLIVAAAWSVAWVCSPMVSAQPAVIEVPAEPSMEVDDSAEAVPTVGEALLPDESLSAAMASLEVDTTLIPADRPLVESIKNLQNRVGDGGTDSDRFALGIAQTIGSLERLTQSLYKHGFRAQVGPLRGMMFVRLPVPPNTRPEPIDYETLRGIFRQWGDDLATAEETLAAIQDPSTVRLPLDVAAIPIDFAGDGQIQPTDRVGAVLASLGRNDDGPEGFAVALDAGDVAWLRGYCHLLQAVNDLVLGYDESELFDHVAHLLFVRPVTPLGFLATAEPLFDVGDADIMDAIAMIHLLRLPVQDPARLVSAREHLLQTTRLSRESWTAILAEIDDEHEWIPSPTQAASVTGLRVEAAQVKAWLDGLDETEKLLRGQTLLPFWRGGTKGVNLSRVFTEPTTFDLVLWVQGSAAMPYLEDGALTPGRPWRTLDRVFGGDLLMFSLWFN